MKTIYTDVSGCFTSRIFRYTIIVSICESHKSKKLKEIEIIELFYFPQIHGDYRILASKGHLIARFDNLTEAKNIERLSRYAQDEAS